MSEQTIKKTTLEIFSSVPFSLFQENIINFESNTNQDKFFQSKRCKKVYENDTYGYIDDKSYIDVNIDIELAKTCKYLRFKNKGRWWYGFILQVEFLNARPTVRFYFELDVINTFNREIFDKEQKFQLTQGHFKRRDKEGHFIITDTPQGFELGEKRPVTIQRKSPIEWLVVVAKPTIEVNEDDKPRNVYGTIVGSYKAFRYFIVPIEMANGKVYPFEINGEKSEQQQIPSYMKKITDSFDDGKNTVNQIVNVYTTLYCGIEYELKGDTVVIKDTTGLSVLGIGKGETTGSDGGSTGGGSIGTVEGDYKGGNLTNSGYTLDKNVVNALVNGFRKVGVNVNYNFVIAQLFIESHWGDPNTSLTATKDNNWSGITYPLNMPSDIKVPMSKGTSRGVGGSEGGYYVRFNSVSDFMVAYAFVLSNRNGLYKVEGATTIDAYCNGLFRSGGRGATSDYASAGLSHYKSLLVPTYNAIIKANPTQTSEIAKLK